MKKSILNVAASTPVSISEIRMQVGLSDSDRSQDLLLRSKVDAALAAAEAYTSMCMRTQTLQLTGDCFPRELPVYPISSITSIHYDSPDQDDVELDLADVYQDLAGMYPRIEHSESWPTLASGKPGSVRIVVECVVDELQPDAKAAVLLRAKELFAMRGESLVGATVSPSELSFNALLEPYRRFHA